MLYSHSYFASDNDMNVLVRGMRFMLHLGRTEPLASVIELDEATSDTSKLFWPGNADPDQASASMSL